MNVERRIIIGMIATLLAVPLVFATAGIAAAACSDTWSAVTTSSKSVSLGLGTYTSSVKYRVLTSCQTGFKTKINVKSFTNTFKITHAVAEYTYIDYEGAVLKTCSGLGSGCLVYPGPEAYLDSRHFSHIGNGTYSRSASPDVTFTYNAHAAIWDYWTNPSNPGYIRFVYQFLGNAIFAG